MGFVSPDEFIPVAEECGLIIQIGEWALEQACRQTQAWLDSGLQPGRIAVNLSARQFHKKGFAERVDAILEETGLAPEYLELELTERAFVDRVEEAITVLEALHRRGIRVSIDDFGTGYSSLSYLKRFPISTLKIDRSFVQDIPHDQEDIAIARAIVGLAQSMDLEVVAEGIEDNMQSSFLQALGVEYGQGYFFDRPLSALDFAAGLMKGLN